MSQLDTVRSALRNAVRACLVSSANQAALLNAYPHGAAGGPGGAAGTELGEIASVALGVQDSLFVPYGWEFGAPVDHGYRSGQTWVLGLRLRAMEDPDWLAIGFNATVAADGYAPSTGTIKSDKAGFVAASPMILLSPIDLTHKAIVCYAPIRGVAAAPINWGPDKPAVGSLLFTLGRHATIGEPLAIDRLEHLRLS